MTIPDDKYPGQSGARREHAASIAGLAKLYQERSDKLRKRTVEPALEDCHWQIEGNLRVSLLRAGGSTTISGVGQALKKIWDRLGGVSSSTLRDRL